MNRHKKAIILGGTYPHSSLIKKLIDRGFYTILIDYYENPIAKKYADEHIRESTLAKDKVLAIAREMKVDLVISAFIDQANVTAAYVSEKLNLPCPYDYQTALNVTNKNYMKDIMSKNNICTARYIKINSDWDYNIRNLKYPLIVKPTDSNSSKGVKKIDNKQDLMIYSKEALELSRSKEAIIEEFVSGIEIGIDCYIDDYKAQILMIKERVKVVADNNAQQINCCIWPYDVNEKLKVKVEFIALQIAKAFNLKNCPLMIQAIISHNDVYVLEFGARYGGGESFRLIEKANGVDVVSLSIDSFLGNDVKININWNGYYYADNFIYARKGVFKNIEYEGVNDQCDYITEYKEENTVIEGKLSSNNRVGVFVIKSKNKEELINIRNEVLKDITVKDINGKQVLRTDIYEGLL